MTKDGSLNVSSWCVMSVSHQQQRTVLQFMKVVFAFDSAVFVHASRCNRQNHKNGDHNFHLFIKVETSVSRHPPHRSQRAHYRTGHSSGMRARGTSIMLIFYQLFVSYWIWRGLSNLRPWFLCHALVIMAYPNGIPSQSPRLRRHAATMGSQSSPSPTSKRLCPECSRSSNPAPPRSGLQLRAQSKASCLSLHCTLYCSASLYLCIALPAAFFLNHFHKLRWNRFQSRGDTQSSLPQALHQILMRNGRDLSTLDLLISLFSKIQCCVVVVIDGQFKGILYALP